MIAHAPAATAAHAADDTTTAGPATPARHGRTGPLADFERLFGADFSNVHITEDAEVTTRGALAITEGDHIRFAPGAHQPSTARGRELLAHELAHVVQQRQGRAPAARGTGALAIDAGLEAEADAAAARVMHDQPAALGAAPDEVRGGASAQPKIGFEIELQVVLSQGPFDNGGGQNPYAIQGPSSPEVPYRTVAEVKEMSGEARNALKWDTMVAVQSNHPQSPNKMIYLRWDRTATSGGLKPNDLESYEPGRWVKDVAFSDTVEAPQHHFVDPNLGKEDTVFRDDLYKVVEDHTQTPFFQTVASVLEFVTVPEDEAQEPDPFLAPMRAVMTKAEQIESATSNLSRRIPAHTVFPGARRDLYLGYDGLSSQSMSAHMQATFGLQLDGVPGLLSSKSRGLDVDLQISQRAIEAAKQFLAEAKIDSSTMPKLAGLIHLVCTYLVAGGPKYQGRGGLDKNQVPFLLRHSVSLGRPSSLTVPEKQWLREHAPPEEVHMTWDLWSTPTPIVDTGWNPLEALLQASGRTSSERLLTQRNDSINVATWLRAALWGNDDGMLAWGESQDIPPERCGPDQTTGVVLEERHPCSGMISLSAWEGFAIEQYKRGRGLNRV